MPTRCQSKFNDAKALAQIQRLARLDQVVITSHARRRMAERDVTELDVWMALLTATAAFPQSDLDNWRVEGGRDVDGDDLTLICDLDADVIVVTLF